MQLCAILLLKNQLCGNAEMEQFLAVFLISSSYRFCHIITKSIMSKILDQNFTSLANLFEEILELRNDENATELAIKRKYAALLFVLIKKVNRNEKYKIRSGRDLLQVEKVRVDSNRLQLQNLLYEITHLKREIRRCYNYRSGDEDLDLLAPENYMELLETEASDTNGSIKRQILLECELKLRKQLSNEYKELLESKKKIFQDIVTKTELLASFTPSLRNIIKATGTLQTALQLPIDQQWKMEQLVQLLPKSLYMAYVNSYSLEAVHNEDVTIVVVGSENMVNELEHSGHVAQLKEAIAISLGEDESNLREKLLEPHPLSLQYTIGNSKKNGEYLVVNMRYFPRLDIVTADSKMHLTDADVDIIPPQDILTQLYNGNESGSLPFVNVETNLKKHNLSIEEFEKYLVEKEYGKPYCWLQRICGMQVFDKNSGKSYTRIRYNFEETLKSINEIWLSRLNLFKQIKLLVNKNIEFFVQGEQSPPSCSLLQWASISFEEYASNTATARYINSDFINANNVFFRSVILRGSAKMECFISISNQFPNDSPLWAICVHWNGQYNAENNTAIKVMEHWTNSLELKHLKNSTSLISAQLLRTMNSFDIFLETESFNHKPSEFSKEKPFIKAFSKRIRLRPYRFLKEGHINLFKQ